MSPYPETDRSKLDEGEVIGGENAPVVHTENAA
jgi:hypothetical protein